MNTKIKILAFLAVLSLVAPAIVSADDSTIPAAAPAAAPSTTSPTPKKHHHKHKKKVVSPPVVSNTTVPSPQVGTRAGSAEMPEPDMSGSRGAGDIGGPNRGTGDHTPGTTGTSGQ